MELRQLRHFLAIAEERNFTRAAQRCHIVQSALSTSIRLLEEELKGMLFIRTKRKVELTAAGNAFLVWAKQALQAVENGSLAVADVTGARRGRLSIGTVQSIPMFLNLPSTLAKFHAAHPEIEVHLCQGGAEELNEKVRNRQLDMAIIPIEETDESLGQQIIACDDLVLACAKSHSLAKAKDISLEELIPETFVDFERGNGTRKLVDFTFASSELNRRIGFEVSDLETLLGLVGNGLGVALLPEDIVQSRATTIAGVPFRTTPPCWELVVTYVEGGTAEKSPPVDAAPAAFLTLLLESSTDA